FDGTADEDPCLATGFAAQGATGLPSATASTTIADVAKSDLQGAKTPRRLNLTIVHNEAVRQ
ncbi:MAG TPA: hypothetical protein VGI20_07260, partial [Rhizomicrobium sp.]